MNFESNTVLSITKNYACAIFPTKSKKMTRDASIKNFD